MVWSIVGSPILLNTDWQYTDPVEGIYFRIKHSDFPINSSYLIAQAQVNLDGSLELADIQELQAVDELQVISLKAPPVFSDRRIAIARIPKQSSFASEIRRVIRNDLLQDSGIESLARRSTWSVAIEASDYVEPVTSNGNVTPSTDKTLTYVSDGDANGLFYWLGTNFGTEAWTNPHTAGRLILSVTSTDYNNSGAITGLVDRANSDFFTQDSPNQRITILLPTGYKLIPNYYLIKTGNDDFPRNWKLQGLSDNAEWIDLNAQVNNTTLVSANQNLSIPISGVTTGYGAFSILQTGVNSVSRNYLRLGEIELYGTLTHTT